MGDAPQEVALSQQKQCGVVGSTDQRGIGGDGIKHAGLEESVGELEMTLRISAVALSAPAPLSSR